MEQSGGFLGLDVGSTTVKAVRLDAAGVQAGTYLAPASGDYHADIARALAAVGEPAEYAASTATGYAQDLVPGVTRTLSEITCHARGAHRLAPDAELVIDIGGQDCKAIRLGPDGRPQSFQMNDKCAAGTGRFLEVMARALGVETAGLAGLALQAQGTVRINSMCTVFAESEVIGLLARGTPRADVASALLDAAAVRVQGMAARLGAARRVVLSGGVAQNAGVVQALSRRLGTGIVVLPQPQLVGALGAALSAMHSAGRSGPATP